MSIYGMAGHLIRRLNQISTHVFSVRMQEAGIDLTSVQFAALETIRAEPGIDQATVAAKIAYDRATIGGVIDRLEQKNYVKRSVSQRDRRAREVTLSEKGKDILAAAMPVVIDLQNEILGGLTPNERETFLKLAGKAVVAVTDDNTRP
ncbi:MULTISPECIES: MarR family transcriptional regulator [unclassified Ruegeria]|uniref:MarR family winged helix-turn-helix transcriptional regulator n=1 Tax=unclassified Ruegeria TaxID=2625375 RepID=UPI001AE7AB91|nr:MULTISPECIES: MarR family transcriptional regulator [unclassified Ruegeria]